MQFKIQKREQVWQFPDNFKGRLGGRPDHRHHSGLSGRLSQQRYFSTVWLGTAVAILISLGTGLIFFSIEAEFKGGAERFCRNAIYF